MVKGLLVGGVLVVSGCASNYQLGDFSRAYCSSTSQEFRTQLRMRMDSKGIKIGVDYCLAHNLVDAVL